MYEPFFGLGSEPFSVAPDPRFMYLSDPHREALRHLEIGLRGGGGFVLLTGEIGAGKTTVWRSFLERLPNHFDVATVVNPKLGVDALLARLCEDLGVSLPEGPARDPIDALHGHLLLAHARGRRTLVAVDEAQALSDDVLEQLRLLTNLVTSDRKLVQVLLIGQPELLDLLERPVMEPLAQRVVARYHLPALPEAETRRYIAHRLAVAGASGPLPFDDAALGRIHALCGGVPRRINVLCDRALLAAWERRERQVGPDLVDLAAREVFARPVRVRAPLPVAAVAAEARMEARAEGLAGMPSVVPSDVPPDVAPTALAAETAAVMPSPIDPAAALQPSPRTVDALTTAPPPAPPPAPQAPPIPAVEPITQPFAAGPEPTAAAPLSPVARVAIGVAVVVAAAAVVAWAPWLRATVPAPSTVADTGRLPVPTPEAEAGSSNPAAVSATQAAAAVPVPTTSGPTSALASSPPVASLEDLYTLSGDEAAALRALARGWGVQLDAGDPCALPVATSLRCYRGRGGLATLRQLDRPAVLRLADGRGRTAAVLLVGLGPQSARVRTGFALNAPVREIPLAELARDWRGEFATLWRSPPGWREDRPITAEDTALLRWLTDRLRQAGGAGTGTLEDQVFAFQIAQGLVPDGLAGPQTLMQLNRATGLDEPRLLRR